MLSLEKFRRVNTEYCEKENFTRAGTLIIIISAKIIVAIIAQFTNIS